MSPSLPRPEYPPPDLVRVRVVYDLPYHENTCYGPVASRRSGDALP